MKRFLGLVLAFVMLGSLSLVCNTQPVKASGTIYIRADGSIDPPGAPISTVDNATYTLTGNITSDADGIVVERDSIVVDGAGYTIQGIGIGTGFYWSGISNVTIKNINIRNHGDGIVLDSSSGNIISGNNITNNGGFGIGLWSSGLNSVSGNNITANNWDGIHLETSDGNSISGNDITANNGAGIGLDSSSNYNSVSGNNITANDYGIWGSSSNSTISGNNITANNWDGVSLYSSSNCSISGNNITNNGYGIGLSYSSNYNSIFHNSFVNNSIQVYSYSSVNIWDDGYPSGGNYWSDYAGLDAYHGSVQDQNGGDGMGDTPYVIDADNRDNYPLMKAFPWDQHDTAVTMASVSKTVCGQGYKTRVNAMVFNYGENTETLNVTAYSNGTIPIEIVPLELAGRTALTVNFTWNTTGFAYGNYTISAYATPVEGETLTEDNTLADGWVFVTIPSDVNGDKRVNILDCILIANHFGHVGGDGHTPGSKEWFDCLNCNINSDSKTNVLDCIILSNSFGQSWT